MQTPVGGNESLYKKVPYAQAIEKNLTPTQRHQVGRCQEGRRQGGGQGVQQRNRSSHVRGDASVRSIETVDNEARSRVSENEGIQRLRRQLQFSHDTRGRAMSVLLRPGRAKHIRGGARGRSTSGRLGVWVLGEGDVRNEASGIGVAGRSGVCDRCAKET